MASNLATPYYEEGDELTGHCTADVVGRTFLKISAARQAGGPSSTSGASSVSDSVVGGNVSVATAGAGDKVLGVAMYDQTSGNLVPVMRSPKIMPVVTAASLTAGQEVQSDAAGKAIVLASGKAAGYVLDDCPSGGIAQVVLYT